MLATTCTKTDDVISPQELGTTSNKLGTDDRTISEEQLRARVCEDNQLSTEQQEDLYNVLAKYRQHVKKRPGKCTQSVYEFKIEGSMPHSANSRPIPFALRNQVSEQVRAMLKDGILEESHTAYINPTTLVVREGKAVRICLDARRINRQMVADRSKVMPMREILQNFYRAKYITSLDLSSAFLQIPLEKSSRQWSAFQFESNVYQFTTVPYGFKYSLAAFIGALEKVLGDCGLNNNMVMYVDDLLIHSSTFTEHLYRFDLVLDKLTSAGFTVNAAKCQFCKPEIKFLGHIISDGVKANRERTEVILSYSVPKNQRQLRKFFGICDFHQQFILDYSTYVEALLILLRKGNKWQWTDALQQAFETLRAKFSHSIQLIHKYEQKGWIINPDASGHRFSIITGKGRWMIQYCINCIKGLEPN